MSGISTTRAALVAAALFAFIAGAATGEEMNTWDGLTRVKGKRLDDVFMLQGADFSGYSSFMLKPVEVAMQKNWQRDMNDHTRQMDKVTTEDITKIRTEVAKGVQDIFSEELQKGGYEMATEPGPNTLSLLIVIADLYINAPDALQQSAGRSKTYTFEAGSAMLAVEVRDAHTNQLLGRAVDRREARSNRTMQWTTSVSNRADFKNLFRTWAKICVKGLDDIKEGKVPPPVKSKSSGADAAG
jgi:hypothetical protein